MAKLIAAFIFYLPQILFWFVVAVILLIIGLPPIGIFVLVIVIGIITEKPLKKLL